MSNIKTNKIMPFSGSDILIDINSVDSGVIFYSDAHFSGGITSSGLVQLLNTTSSSSSTTGALVVSGGVGVGGALNVASTGSFGGTLTLAGATSSAIISCGTAPTQGQHLANKTYVDSTMATSIVSNSSAASYTLTLALTPGTWFIEVIGYVHVSQTYGFSIVLQRTGKPDVTISSVYYNTGADYDGTETHMEYGGTTATVTSADAPLGTETVTIRAVGSGSGGTIPAIYDGNSLRLYATAIKTS